jgi:hypothetical protein
MGDVDLFALTAGGSALTVNGKWLQHLEERLLGEDGHPRKAREGEDPHRWGGGGVSPQGGSRGDGWLGVKHNLTW